MALVSRRNRQEIDESVDDRTWIRQGNQPFEAGKARSFGSPETMRAGGDHAADQSDIAAALFFYAKAVDIAQTWANYRPGQRPVGLEVELFDAYATTLESIRRSWPGADVVGDWNNENAKHTLGMMVSITRIYAQQGRPAPQLGQFIERVVARHWTDHKLLTRGAGLPILSPGLSATPAALGAVAVEGHGCY